MNKLIITACTLAATAGLAQADIVTVIATGEVYFNAINDGELGAVGSGETATVSLQLDSGDYVDGVPGDLRSYAIVPGSFTLSFSGGSSVGLANPYPDGLIPNFTVVDGFPVSDGFFISDFTTSPGGVDLDQGDYQFTLELGYVGDTLGSLDITEAYGTYDYDGLTRFNMGVWRIVPDNIVMGIDFTGLTIIPSPASLAILGMGGLAATRRRR